MTRERRILSRRSSRDCEWNRDPLIHHCKAVFRGRADILFTFIPTFRSRWGSEDVVELGMERGTEGCVRARVCIYGGESSGERWIYPDTEIFASMLSTITHRTSSTEGRAIFQATAGVTCIGLRACAPIRESRVHVHEQTPRENQSSRSYLTRLLACVQTRHWWLEFSWNSSRTCFILPSIYTPTCIIGSSSRRRQPAFLDLERSSHENGRATAKIFPLENLVIRVSRWYAVKITRKLNP